MAVPVQPTIPPPPLRTSPSDFSELAAAFVAFLANEFPAYLSESNSFVQQQAQAALAAAIAGNLSALDLSALAGRFIGINGVGNALEGVHPARVLASDFNMAPNSLFTRATPFPVADFRWIAAIYGENADQYDGYVQVPRVKVTAETVGDPYLNLQVFSDAADSVQLYTVNRTTGALTVIGTPQNVGALDTPGAGMAWDGMNLYAGRIQAGFTFQLYTVNRTTGALTVIGTPQNVGALNAPGAGMAWDGMNLFLIVYNHAGREFQLYTVNRTTGDLTVIGTPQNPSGALLYDGVGLTWDGTQLFLGISASSSNEFQLYTVNRTTGDLTVIGTPQSLGSGSWHTAGMAWDETNLFFVRVSDSNNMLSLGTVDRTTGALTVIGTPQNVGAGYHEGAGMAYVVPVAGGAVADGLRISLDGASSLGFRSQTDRRIHQVIGLP